ncbi:hypothetical protein [Streptomyces sp. NPDC053431]|uniref:hypothetical protein n=1 Tax=Streptomyces sp. NPDC053431 TaxID=3365703 RepID=UPI0037CF30CE
MFRWVLVLGLVLLGGSYGLYEARPGFPELRQIDLVVLDEKPDGTCRVQWVDPFGDRELEGPYHCDPERSYRLKAPAYDEGSGYGWESGFIRTEEPHRGELYALDDSPEPDWRGDLSALLMGLGSLLAVAALIGGAVRTGPRIREAEPRFLRRAARLRDAAAWVVHDHDRAVAAVHAARGDGTVTLERYAERPDAPGAELVRALRVLREAGPSAREAAESGRRLRERLEPLLADAAPAAGYRSVLGAGPEARRRAALAVAALRPLVEEAERAGLPERFAQSSVDLLRGQDADPAGLAAWADFTRDPAAYRRLLADVTGPRPTRHAPSTPPHRRRHPRRSR